MYGPNMDSWRFFFFLKIIFDIGPKGKLGVKETRADKLG